MIQRRTSLGALAFSLAALAASPARGASLQQVQDWGQAGLNLPGDVSMHVYVPDEVAEDPPILALVHYCGGTAEAVFWQAVGGGLVQAADENGFIMVVPSSGRCWDVVSNKAHTRDGGGDSHAIKQMVTHAIDAYGANADRVYATGDSSGGMMTELLLALYPDLFKAGAAFAGMPAGCRGDTESGNGGGYSGACAGGSVTRSPQQWGDIARGMHPDYTGHRPRVQLFHGDADDIIRYPNHTEAIKQWTDVLGLAQEPTSTTMVTLGDHQATRQSWKNDCGYVVLEAFTSLGGDHGPSDALFPAQYVVPFLGLDAPGLVDPEVATCGDGGNGGAGAGGASAGGTGGGGLGGSDFGVGGSSGAGMSGSPGSGGSGGSVSATGGSNTAAGGSGGSQVNPGNVGGTPSAAASDAEDGCSLGRSSPANSPSSVLLGLGLLIALRGRRRIASSRGEEARFPLHLSRD